ncbi:MAG: glycosyltransferase family 2 protein [Candidatus Thermoplasmatota archaeon]|nr:glycosyltransferase family 2 protein [Candidatus Thermoplasmatota archaeon]
MPYFSIEIITRGEKTTESVLKSIFDQTFQSFEVVCANSSSYKGVQKVLDQYSIRMVDTDPTYGTLGARYEANLISSGRYSILLDSTRLLIPEALETIKDVMGGNDMLAIREGSIGKGFWFDQIKLHKEISESPKNVQKFLKGRSSFIIPRVYRRDIIREAFKHLREVIPSRYFYTIRHGDHQLVFEESSRHGSNISFYDENPLILHFEDTDLSSIFKKYYYYGKSQKLIRGMKGYKVSNIMSYRRSVNFYDFGKELLCLPIISVRSASFLLGLLL